MPRTMEMREPDMGDAIATNAAAMSDVFRTLRSYVSRPSESSSTGTRIVKSVKPLMNANVEATRARPVAYTMPASEACSSSPSTIV